MPAPAIQRKFQPLPHLDAAENVFLGRQLEYVRKQSSDIEYAETKIRQLVPVDHEVPSGAETCSYDQYDAVGTAKIIANYADDLPRVDVKAKRFTTIIKGLGVSFGYTLQELRNGMMNGMNLDSDKGKRANESMEQLIDQLGAVGSTAHGIVGLLGIPNATTSTVPAGAAGDVVWGGTSGTAKTALEAMNDVHRVVNTMVANTKEVEKPDTLVLPTLKYGYLATTFTQVGSDLTLLQAILKNSPWIKQIESWERLTGAGAGGTNRGLVYKRDPTRLKLVIPQEFEQLAPQPKGLETLVPCHARCAGVQCMRPISVSYFDGI